MSAGARRDDSFFISALISLFSSSLLRRYAKIPKIYKLFTGKGNVAGHSRDLGALGPYA